MLGVRTAPAALAAATLLALTACSGPDGEASSSTSSTATGTTSPTASATPSPSASEASVQDQVAPPRPPVPPARNTPPARAAWARYVVDAWSYALSTNQATAVTSLSPRGATCEGCADLTEELGTRSKDGWFVDFPGAEVRSVRVTSLSSQPGTWAASVRVDIPASRSYFDDGSFRNDNAAHRNTPFLVTMRWTGNRFALLSFQVG